MCDCHRPVEWGKSVVLYGGKGDSYVGCWLTIFPSIIAELSAQAGNLLEAMSLLVPERAM